MTKNESAADGPDRSGAVADFEVRLRDRLPVLTPKRRKLAATMLADPAGLMLRTVESLAQEAGVDGATVVRLCNDLGYDGFAGLKAGLREDYALFRTAAEKVSETLSGDSGDNDVVAGVFETDRANIALAADWNAGGSVDALARSIRDSRRTVVVAAGVSSYVGGLLAHLLRLAGVDAVAPLTEMDTSVQLAPLGADDLVIGISFWRYIKPTERFVRRAAELGIPTAAISDSRQSGVAKAAQLALRVPTDAAEINNSMAAPMSLINAVVTAVIHLDPRKSLAALEGVDAVLRDTSII